MSGVTSESHLRANSQPEYGMVLVVDDEQSIRDFVSSVLERAGYEVMAAADSQQALEVLRQHAPALLLTDVVMPGMNGLELAAHAHKLVPRLPAIFMTGFAAKYRDELAGTVCLPKPFKPAELLTAVQDVIGLPSRAGQRENSCKHP